MPGGIQKPLAAIVSDNETVGTAIALGAFEAAVRFLDVEIADMKTDSQGLERLRTSTEAALEAHGRSE